MDLVAAAAQPALKLLQLENGEEYTNMKLKLKLKLQVYQF